MCVHINFNNFHLVVLEIEPGVKNRRISHYPFNVECAPAEIISIYKSHNSKLYCSKLREAVSNGNGDTVDTDDGADVQIEVRWLYRLHEIPGTGKSASRIATEMEEVFETDHLDKCPAESILLPVVLLEDKQPIEEGPCVRYYCTRYWSLHRKSFIPIGSPKNKQPHFIVSRELISPRSDCSISHVWVTIGYSSRTNLDRRYSFEVYF